MHQDKSFVTATLGLVLNDVKTPFSKVRQSS